MRKAPRPLRPLRGARQSHVVACGDILTGMYRFELAVDSSTTETAIFEYLDRALALWLPAYHLSVLPHAVTESPETSAMASVSDSDSVEVAG